MSRISTQLGAVGESLESDSPVGTPGPADRPGMPHHSRHSRHPHLLWWSVGSALILLGLWQLASMLLPQIIVPSIAATGVQLGKLLSSEQTYWAAAQSLGSYALGFVIAVTIGALLGLATGLSTRARAAAGPLLSLLNAVPTIAWMGLAMIWFGLGVGPTVFLVVITTVPILATALSSAVQQRDRRFDELAEVFDLPRSVRLRQITLPPLLASTHAAVIAMAGLGWKLTIMGEFLTSSRGLGERLFEAKAHVATDRVIATTVLLVVVWVIVERLLNAAEKLRVDRFASRVFSDRASHSPRPDGSAEAYHEGEILLDCRNVALGYGDVRIAEDLSFSITRGSVTAILGTSGVGKSSLLHVIAGLRPVQGGSLELAPGLQTSYVFQDDRLLPWCSLEQNVALVSGASSARAREQLALLGLGEAATKMPDELSGGMRRRGALARGFLRDASLLLLDEPFAGLDVRRRLSLRADIQKLRQVRGHAIIFVTHDVDDALMLADQAIVLGAPSVADQGGAAPPAATAATIVDRIDLSHLGRERRLNDLALATPRNQLLTALL